MISLNIAIAILLCRILLGLLFFIQGIDKAFNIKVRGVVDAYRFPEADNHLPYPLVYAGAIYTTYAEFIAGLLLVAGLFTSVSLYLLAIDLVIVTIGTSTKQPLLDLKYIFPRLALIVFLLLTPADWNTISLDKLIGLIK